MFFFGELRLYLMIINQLSCNVLNIIRKEKGEKKNNRNVGCYFIIFCV